MSLGASRPSPGDRLQVARTPLNSFGIPDDGVGLREGAEGARENITGSSAATVNDRPTHEATHDDDPAVFSNLRPW